ncbi:hypothetical protein LCGC14_1466080 [marine sediment metagenome]|uniref:Uncharacterized protein n=1 Tax=marine sediment metagenome TaxID=412755 RepID=A0A0F9JEA8_9ZZZZ
MKIKTRFEKIEKEYKCLLKQLKKKCLKEITILESKSDRLRNDIEKISSSEENKELFSYLLSLDDIVNNMQNLMNIIEEILI